VNVGDTGLAIYKVPDGEGESMRLVLVKKVANTGIEDYKVRSVPRGTWGGSRYNRRFISLKELV